MVKSTTLWSAVLLGACLATAHPAEAQSTRSVAPAGGHVVIGNHEVHNITGDLTVMASFKLDSLVVGDNILLSKEGRYEIGINSANGRLKWAMANTQPGWQWSTTNVKIETDTWYHLAFVYSLGERVVKIYLNHALVESAYASGTIGDYYSNQPIRYNELWIGDRQAEIASPNVKNFVGLIDEVHLWNRGLDSASVYDFMECPPTGEEEGLVGYWKFEEKTGTTARDWSSHQHDGELVGKVTWSDEEAPFECLPCRVTETITVYDTVTVSVYDTTRVTVYDTVSIAVTDTLYMDIEITGAEEAPALHTIKVFPNPAKDYVIVDNGDISRLQSYRMVIINSLGQEVFRRSINTVQFRISVQELGAQGVYTIQLFDDTMRLVDSRKLILH
ncbi:Por secretion system C-terminal sorting domain-containing protein [Catalinimonas alkaloidigena]|uniref:Por secretion system C-terminal sorting domain-containing protein n=1 Tax=Catalinimonas alkaloidigena TaxID=1075417 RepID=A0A1G9A3S9_9BACT|nr:LamG-like jellyroll fold domain-containing protein [Catalinimonas alkaloidigena]SDK21907.1 Por secretion system C-terminal sorting domain-containing protein [Catalinimonas alkaloidigena]